MYVCCDIFVIQNEDQISTNMVEVATTSSEIASIIEDDPDNEEDYITTFGPPVNNKNKPTIVLKVIIPIMIYIYIKLFILECYCVSSINTRQVCYYSRRI